MKKSLKKFIWEEMEKKGYVLDWELAKFCGKEVNYYTAEVYKREYNLLNQWINNNAYHNDPTSEIHKGRRMYLVRNEEIKKIDENRWMKIPKIYFEYLKNNGVRIV